MGINPDFWDGILLEESLRNVRLSLKERRAKRFYNYVHQFGEVFIDHKRNVAKIGDREMPADVYERIYNLYVQWGEGTIPFREVEKLFEEYLR